MEMSKTEWEGEEIAKTLYQGAKDIPTVDQTGWKQSWAVCGLCGIERERHRWTEKEEIEDGEASKH